MTAQTVTVVQLVTTHRSALLIIRECQSPGSAQSIYLHRQVHPDIFGQIPLKKKKNRKNRKKKDVARARRLAH